MTDNGLVFLDEAQQSDHRLFLLAAGNVRTLEEDHLTRSDLEEVEDPGQAWNALTVGAFTDRDTLLGAPAGFPGWTCLAPRGELSPFSRTSVLFKPVWPVKPDVVMEGGNVARIRLFHADAQDLAPLPSARFDLVYCNLALMDIANLTATYAAVARVLRQGGRFVFTLVHPCFNTPGSDIAPDADGRIRAAIVRRYTEEGHWTSGRTGAWRNKVGAHHRTLSTYVNGLLSSGFTLLRIEEPVLRNRQDLSGIAELWAHLPPVLLVEARPA